jgi:hypothetical protein
VLYVNGPGTLPEDLDATGATWVVVAFAYTHWQLQRNLGLTASVEDARTWTFRVGEWGLADHPVSTPQTYLSDVVATRLETWRTKDPVHRRIWLSIGGDGFGAGASSVYAVWAAQGEAYVDSLVGNLQTFLAGANVAFSGVDVDFEDTNALLTSSPTPYSGHDLMVWMGKALAARNIPYSFAPQSPYLTETVYGGFIPILARLSSTTPHPHLFIQFYNNPSFAICTSDTASAANGWTIERLLRDAATAASGAHPLTRTVAGTTYTLPAIATDDLYVIMPAQAQDAANGFVAATALSACIGDHSLHNGLGLWRGRVGGEAAIRALFEAVPCT